jgi:aminoglycoside phosphotransferase
MLDNLKKQLEKTFPNEKIILETDGWASYDFTVGDDIIRIPKSNIKGYEKERDVLKFLKGKISVEIPSIEVVKGDDLSYSKHKKIKGLNWDIKTFNKLSAKDKDLFCHDIAIFFAEIHRVSIEDILLEVPDLKKDEVSFPKDKISNCLKSDFSENEIEKVYIWIEELKEIKNDLVFSHQDFHSYNSLVDENHRLKCVFDFGNACIDDRSIEFNGLYWPDYTELLSSVIKHYKEITNIQVDLEKIKKINEARCIDIISYLGDNPELKIKKLNDWNTQIDVLKKIIKDIKIY